MKSFFLSPVSKQFNLQVPESLRNANSSFIMYKKIKEHINFCNSCDENTNIITSRCILLKQVLYPYGLYISDDVKKQFFLHKGLNLDNWCIPCKEEEIDEKNNILHKNKINYKSNLFLNETGKLYKRCLKKDGLCKCTYNLFVGPFNEKVVVKSPNKKKSFPFKNDSYKKVKLQKPNHFGNKEEEVYFDIKSHLINDSSHNSLQLVDNIIKNIKYLGDAQKEDIIKKYTEEQEDFIISSSNIFCDISIILESYLDGKIEEFQNSLKKSYSLLISDLYNLKKKISIKSNLLYIDYFNQILITLNHSSNIYDQINILKEENKNNLDNANILKDINRLQKYIKNINWNNIGISSLSINASPLKLKPEYIIYHEQYGIPANFNYDRIKLLEIKSNL